MIKWSRTNTRNIQTMFVSVLQSCIFIQPFQEMHPPISVRLAADLRPSADGSSVHTSLVAGQVQAASVPIA